MNLPLQHVPKIYCIEIWWLAQISIKNCWTGVSDKVYGFLSSVSALLVRLVMFPVVQSCLFIFYCCFNLFPGSYVPGPLFFFHLLAFNVCYFVSATVKTLFFLLASSICVLSMPLRCPSGTFFQAKTSSTTWLSSRKDCGQGKQMLLVLLFRQLSI